MVRKKKSRRLFKLLVIVFILMNIVANFHAYKFTHFSTNNAEKTKKPSELGFTNKLSTLAFGVNNPKPTAKAFPSQPYKTIVLQSNKKINCWYVTQKDSTKSSPAKGTIIIFHGYGGEKSSMLDKSNEFIRLGYNTFLVDFMGSGDSEGNQTTLGFKEAEEVKTAFEYLQKQREQNIFLFGTSLGAVAILKAINDYSLPSKGIIVECPFGSMYQTTSIRFENMGLPSFPMAGLLVFWGGVQNGFWAFGHRPTAYATNITCPTLLLYGEKDKNVSSREIDDIFNNLQGRKTLKTYPLAGHENYLIKYREKWIKDISTFLQQNQPND